MRILSNFKDYYDFAGFAERNSDYRETIYLRKSELKVTDAALQAYVYSPVYHYCYAGHSGRVKDKIKSRWWEENRKIFALSAEPESVRSGCVFVCGKAYPFLFLRGAAQIGTQGKNGQIRLSRSFNETIKNSIAKQKRKEYWQENSYDDDTFNFFHTYFSQEELFEDVTIDASALLGYRQPKLDTCHQREIKQFFDFYEGKDFTPLHVKLDSPLLFTVFECREGNRGNPKKEFEFLLNPNLYELDFARVVPGVIMLQELDMMLGNVLVKDVMPQYYQSDLDKLTSHGFDPESSFRNTKSKKS